MLRTIVVFISKRFCLYKNIYLLDINISCVIFYLSYFNIVITMFRFCIYVLDKDLLTLSVKTSSAQLWDEINQVYL
jgi:hypothetical protein